MLQDEEACGRKLLAKSGTKQALSHIARYVVIYKLFNLGTQR